MFSSFFRWAARFDRIGANPMDRIDRPRRRRAERHSHSIAKVTALIDAQPALRDRICLSLMARLGLEKMGYGFFVGETSTWSEARSAYTAKAESWWTCQSGSTTFGRT
jgi:hypothetical protein